MGHCVTKDVQGLHLATFHSMAAVEMPLVVEGHWLPHMYPNEGRLLRRLVLSHAQCGGVFVIAVLPSWF